MSKSEQPKKRNHTAQEIEQLLQEVHLLNYKQKNSSHGGTKRAERLMAEIDRLHAKACSELDTPADLTNNSDSLSERLSVRIGKLERDQQQALKQIQKLSDAKIQLELSRVQSEKKASAQQREETKKLKTRLLNLMSEREEQYSQLHEEVQAIRSQNKEDNDLLATQRDAARALAQEQNALTEQNNSALFSPAIYKWLIFVAIVVLILLFSVIMHAVYLSLQKSASNNEAPMQTPKETRAVTTQIKEETDPALESAPLKPAPPKKPEHQLIQIQDKLQSGGMGPMMTIIPAGELAMGSRRVFHSEYPEVHITMQSYAISQHEISFADYRRFSEATGTALPNDEDWGYGVQPVINIRWEQANTYAAWLSQQTGQHYRLPSEREWEYAAKAGTRNKYWWGNYLGKNRANCANCGSRWDGERPAPVGSFPANPFGLYDVVGNVMEWTHTCYHNSYKNSPKTGNLWAGGDCKKRMVRGGAFSSYKKEMRLSRRLPLNAKARSNHLGFRVVRLEK